MPEKRTAVDPARFITDVERSPRNHWPAMVIQPQIPAQFTRYTFRLGRLQSNEQALLDLKVFRNHQVVGVDHIIQALDVGRFVLLWRQGRQVLPTLGQQITSGTLQCRRLAGIPLHPAQFVSQLHKPRCDGVVSLCR
ncbi:hypothetical protein ALP64_204116 [Pseudomonas syringae pv. actinidiae]|nr:hypothetical protein ALP64_204116 [Pseudomonas syringae pv. actinidiae]